MEGFLNKKLAVWTVVAIVAAAGLSGYFLFIKPNEPSTRTDKVYRVGILNALDFFSDTIDGFKQKMSELGYIEGKNIIYDVQKSPNVVGNENILEKFMADKVDLIVTFPTEASLEAKKVTQGTDIPVVFTNSGLDGVDLVSNLKMPGGNITGVQFPGADNAVQRLEILHEIAPDAKRFYIAWLDGYPIVPEELRRLKITAEPLGITIIEVPVKSLDDIKADFAKREEAEDIGIDAILIVPEPLTAIPEVFTALADFAGKHNIPMGGAFIAEGSLFGYTPNAFKVGIQAAAIADKIFKGTPPGVIPIATAENDLIINFKLAKEKGFTISEALLSRAQKIVR